MDEGNAKALLRRAIAWENIGEYHKSLDDILKARQLESGRVYEQETCRLYSRVTQALKIDQAVMREDRRPDHFLTCHQTLRLNFGYNIPTFIVNGKACFFRLNVTNEFGLWHRDNMLSGTASGSSCHEGGGVVLSPMISCSVVREWGCQSRVSISSSGSLGSDGRVGDTSIPLSDRMTLILNSSFRLTFELS